MSDMSDLTEAQPKSSTQEPVSMEGVSAQPPCLANQSGKSRDRVRAEHATGPIVAGANTLRLFAHRTLGEIKLRETVAALKEASHRVNSGDMRDVEAMLVTQAAALNVMFADLSSRSMINMGEYPEAADRYMRMAMKAQNQCRMTLETLANVKNPSVVIARQANIANGPQQVNNGTALSDARAGENQFLPNKLLETENVERVDTGAACAASGGHPGMATLEPVDRAEDTAGESQSRT